MLMFVEVEVSIFSF
jgi:hypothetical protein